MPGATQRAGAPQGCAHGAGTPAAPDSGSGPRKQQAPWDPRSHCPRPSVGGSEPLPTLSDWDPLPAASSTRDSNQDTKDFWRLFCDTLPASPTSSSLCAPAQHRQGGPRDSAPGEGPTDKSGLYPKVPGLPNPWTATLKATPVTAAKMKGLADGDLRRLGPFSPVPRAAPPHLPRLPAQGGAELAGGRVDK